MLPSRSRLERWNPDTLTSAGQSIIDTGRAVEEAVTAVSTNIATMPDTRAWSGGAHSAATSMFERAAKQTGAFTAYTTAVGQALADGAGTIGATRTALLDKADHLDMGGQLHVSDQWAVLITGAPLSAEQTAVLERRAQAEQAVVNRLLLAVGAADDETAAAVTGAAQPFGFEVPNPAGLGGLLVPGTEKPGDDVPDPSTTLGLLQQATIRDADMAQTIRDTKVEKQFNPDTGEEVATTTTLFMQDGSRHVRTVNAEPQFSDRGPLTTEVQFDKDGNKISETTSVVFEDWAHHSLAGSKSTTTQLADGTVIHFLERPNGQKVGTITTPDGRQADVPLDLYNHPILTAAGAGLSGVENQAGKGIPMLTDEATEKVRIGAKYGGPALGIATALWDVAVADSGFEKCVAAAEGATSVAAGTLGGIVTAPMTPLVTTVVVFGAAGGGQALGNWIGNMFCPR
ncbi:hypothetical protein C6A87_025695 [Mycobacterium sp. ITM-2016-00317]|uniref:hypothetical protein n=1 Tax=Mycobacterium sp. ITM-2016-00317 TaxID=2099694 RepID=UPI00287F76AA|nr:hypothetical protein [Mycobacterium sp. ITM-2016-00317]WNG87132.1 hypothetical protein C6A87_025695 [Mycobacterium sp. ITM-2016-00317]